MFKDDHISFSFPNNLLLIFRTHLKRAKLGEKVWHGETGEAHTKGIKQEAVQLTQLAGGAITQLARDYGINADMLGR